MKYFKFYLTLIFLLIIPLINAETQDITLKVDQPQTFKGVTLNLVDIGSKGSAILKVNGIQGKILLQGKWEIEGIEIRIKEIFYTAEKKDRQAVLTIRQLADCLINEDCKDNNPCTNDLCVNKKCSNDQLNGCILGNNCMNLGNTTVRDNTTYYCQDNEWKKQKSKGEKCLNNHECESNYCDKVCKIFKIKIGGEEMAPKWILIVFGVLALIKGLLYLALPDKTRSLINKFIKGNDLFFRIIGILALIIGLILIIWALT